MPAHNLSRINYVATGQLQLSFGWGLSGLQQNDFNEYKMLLQFDVKTLITCMTVWHKLYSLANYMLLNHFYTRISHLSENVFSSILLKLHSLIAIAMSLLKQLQFHPVTHQNQTRQNMFASASMQLIQHILT